MSKVKLYVGCSLTHATPEFVAGIGNLKGALRVKSYEVLDFMWDVDKNASPKEIFAWDILQCIKNCDGFIAICDEPSIGLGYEIASAVNLKKPVLALAQEEAKVSKLVLGAGEALPNVDFKRYTDINLDVIPMVKKWLASHQLA